MGVGVGARVIAKTLIVADCVIGSGVLYFTELQY